MLVRVENLYFNDFSIFFFFQKFSNTYWLVVLYLNINLNIFWSLCEILMDYKKIFVYVNNS